MQLISNRVFHYVRLLDTLELYELYSTWSADEALKVSFSEQQEKKMKKARLFENLCVGEPFSHQVKSRSFGSRTTHQYCHFVVYLVFTVCSVIHCLLLINFWMFFTFDKYFSMIAEHSQCLKITQNVAFEFSNFGIYHQIVYI